ncbi:MAG: ABC transporter ATP-binding protein, partial [Clostridia bacterium]|nr:ABC transporter ATP-binding protein [Clostridia bacterium]
MKDLLDFLKYFKPHKKLFAIDLLCALLMGLISVAFPLMINHALHTYLPNLQMRQFFIIVLCVILMYAVYAVLTYIVGYIGHIFGMRVETDIREELFAHLQKLSFKFYDKHRVGDLMARVTTDLFEITEVAHHGPEDAVLFFIVFIGSFISMLLINWRFTLCIIWLVPVGLIFIYSRRKQTKRCSWDSKKKLSTVTADLETSLNGIRVTRSFANEDYEIKRFAKSNVFFKKAKGGFYREFAFFLSGVDFVKNLLKISVVLVGGFLYIKGLATFAQIITFNLFITILLQPMQKLISFSEMFMNGMAGFGRFKELMATEPEIVDKENAAVLTDVQGNIDIENLSFTYDGEDVLHDINLHIKKGETLALVGPSGAGKTTLCQLIPRFYEIDRGAIKIDGTDICDVTMKSLRTNIDIVQQDVYIFTDTVLENIRYGSYDKTEEDVIAAAKMAEIHEDIMNMVQGYQTHVGEKGAILSGGQKQRISLARMFLKNPPIIIFDEATSALDTITEQKIQGAIDTLSKGRTIIIIAHRLSTIKNATHIALIDKGTIIEYGSHNELM